MPFDWRMERKETAGAALRVGEPSDAREVAGLRLIVCAGMVEPAAMTLRQSGVVRDTE
ncbi:MAG: hypothetical protein KDE11_01270 [Rhodobacteraceae bacterium]|nr:hypothetical protein [Paracoccaceae bacterium]